MRNIISMIVVALAAVGVVEAKPEMGHRHGQCPAVHCHHPKHDHCRKHRHDRSRKHVCPQCNHKPMPIPPAPKRCK